MNFIDRLRAKPSSTKKIIAFCASGSVTLLILIIWISVLNFGIGFNKDSQVAAVNDVTDVNPLSAFVTIFSKGWDDLVNNMSQIKNSAR